ncbi:MAG: sulfatase family protein [Opitutales bacterium]
MRFSSIVLLIIYGLILKAEERPNIIFFLADDQRADVLGAYGNTFAITPTLDRLASEGVLFENAFCQAPICAASRATLFTGLTQRTHGYNFGKPPVPSKYIETSYPAALKSSGYRVGFAGKYGVKFQKPGLRKTFDFYQYINRSPYIKKLKNGTERHETDLCADAAIRFIESAPKNSPFCLSVSFNATHAEDKDRRPGYHFQWPESADGLYEATEFPEPKLSNPEFFEALPDFLKNPNELSRERFFWRWDTPEKYQANIQAYFRMLTGIDNAIARVLEALEQQGLSENTVIIYTADNGFHMGDRGLAGKWNPYEQSLSIPLIIFDPRLTPENRGRSLKEIINNVDLPATLLDLAHVEIPEIYQGQSLVPLLQAEGSIPWRKDTFFEHAFRRYNDWHTVRGERFKYSKFYDTPHESLFDLKNDPNELKNLASNPEYAHILKQKQERLEFYLTKFPKANGR